MLVSSHELIGELRAIVDQHHTKDHPFIRKIANGELTKKQLKICANDKGKIRH